MWRQVQQNMAQNQPGGRQPGNLALATQSNVEGAIHAGAGPKGTQ
jgi:hypothetical protein